MIKNPDDPSKSQNICFPPKTQNTPFLFAPFPAKEKSTIHTSNLCSFIFGTCFLSSDHCDGNPNQCRFLLQYHPPIRHIDHKGCHCTWPSNSDRGTPRVWELKVKTKFHGFHWGEHSGTSRRGFFYLHPKVNEYPYISKKGTIFSIGKYI